MKIRKLHLKNIGVFDDEEIEFKECPAKDKAEIHILTGENGTGKTTILMSLASTFVGGFGFGSYGYDLNSTSPKSLDSANSIFFRKRLRKPSEKDRLKKFDLSDESFEDGFNTIKCSFDNGKSNFWGVVGTNGLRTVYNYEGTSDYTDLVQNYERESFLKYAVFAFSGYRYINSERIEAIKEPENFNPLYQSLDFVKNYSTNNQLSINQLIANNFSKSAIERDRNREKSEKFARVVSSIEQMLSEITGWKIEFDLQTEPTNLITKVNNQNLDFDALPDGLRSLISWIADLLGRVDLLKWQDNLPITEKNLIIFLDEIEVHLHPAWQRKVLPVVQKLFKNAQIFVSTHSPFVVNSVDDAWVYKLKVDENGKAKVESVEKSEDARSYRYVLRNTFDIENEFGIAIENRLKDFYKERDSFLEGNGNSKKAKIELKKIAKELSKQSKELKSKIDFELFQLSEITGEDF